MSRVWAGVNWLSDVEQGLILGRAVADRVLAQAATDRSDASWDGKPLTGSCYWKPTPPGFTYPPLEPLWGRVRPWLLVSGDLVRPARTPACGSGEERDQMLEVYRTGNNLTEEQKRIASFWNDGPGTVTPPGHWAQIALNLIERYSINTPRAARLLAYQGVASMDVGICVWDAKFAYWSLRAVTYIQDYVDPNWTSFVTTPPFPGFVSGHSAFSGASATVLGYMVPQEKTALQAMAAEAALSRLYGGIHIRADNEVGLTMGRRLGALASMRALRDDIEDLIGRRVVDRGRGNSLIAKLETVSAHVNQKDISGAIKDLQAFMSEVITAIAGGHGQPLVDAASEIINYFR
jgi:membrane-associated phospholipid phosphatase